MFAPGYFAPAYFAPRYFPPSGEAVTGGAGPPSPAAFIRRKFLKVEREIVEVEERIEVVSQALPAEPARDEAFIAEIRGEVDRELAQLLRLQAEAQVFDLERRLLVLRRNRKRLLALMAALFVIISAS